jgi:DNA-binding NtrC family response regulator
MKYMETAIKSILLVDDDQDDKFFFSTALSHVSESIELITASEGSEAFEKLAEIKPDLILLDLIMPGMNGMAFLKRYQESPALHEIPVIVYTTDLSIFEEQEVLKRGAAAVYIKPQDFDKTVKTIENILRVNTFRQSA